MYHQFLLSFFFVSDHFPYYFESPSFLLPNHSLSSECFGPRCLIPSHTRKSSCLLPKSFIYKCGFVLDLLFISVLYFLYFQACKFGSSLSLSFLHNTIKVQTASNPISKQMMLQLEVMTEFSCQTRPNSLGRPISSCCKHLRTVTKHDTLRAKRKH